jgi:phosphopantothenoylcysteine synthetase/decarboxylase
VTATPSALDFLDVDEIGSIAGTPVRSTHRRPSRNTSRDLPDTAAMIVAPATFNTINKFAAGIADNYALISLAEASGRGVPVVIVPFVNSALSARAPFRRSLAQLREEGIRILLGVDDDWLPHPPGTGSDRAAQFPWTAALELAETAANILPGI